MKFIQSFLSFLNEKKEEKDFEDKIKGHGYFKGISVSTARKKMAQMKDQAAMSDDDPDAYKPMPGSTKGKKLLKPSTHTKNYKELYDDEKETKNESIINWELYQKMNGQSTKIDTEYKYSVTEKYITITATGLDKDDKAALIKMGANVTMMGPGWYINLKDTDKKKVLAYLDKEGIEVNESINEEDAGGDRSPIDNDAIESGLKKKSEETGVPLPLLRIVMRRGMAAWKSGHRPGAGQEQWGYARVNSFLTQAPGTWGRPIKDPVKGAKDAYGADADVAQEVIKGGHDKNLKKG